jgi:hypothetical protein
MSKKKEQRASSKVKMTPRRLVFLCSMLIANCSFVLLICHFSFVLLIPLTLPAQHGILIPFIEAVVAHPFAAFPATVKLHEGFQIGGFKRYEVVFPPQQRPGFLRLDGQAAGVKRNGLASPFLPADVAEKAETKAVFVRMVNYFPGQRLLIFSNFGGFMRLPSTKKKPVFGVLPL